MTGLKALDSLLGFFHEDWIHEYGDPWSVVEHFVYSQVDDAPNLRSDIDELLDQNRPDAELRNLLLWRGGLSYDVTADGWPSYRAWLLAVADRVDALLAKQPGQDGVATDDS